MLITAKTVYAQFLHKMNEEEQTIDEVYPIPTCQYEKKTKDMHLIHQVETILEHLCDLITQMKQNFVRIQD